MVLFGVVWLFCQTTDFRGTLPTPDGSVHYRVARRGFSTRRAFFAQEEMSANRKSILGQVARAEKGRWAWPYFRPA